MINILSKIFKNKDNQNYYSLDFENLNKNLFLSLIFLKGSIKIKQFELNLFILIKLLGFKNLDLNPKLLKFLSMIL